MKPPQHFFFTKTLPTGQQIGNRQFSDNNKQHLSKIRHLPQQLNQLSVHNGSDNIHAYIVSISLDTT